MTANLKHRGALPHQPPLRQALPSASGVRENTRDQWPVRDRFTAIRQKTSRIFLRLSTYFLTFTRIGRFLWTRKTILNGEKLFDLSTQELKARKLIGPLMFNLYKTILAALPAIAIAWLIYWRQHGDLETTLAAQRGSHFWNALLGQWQVIRMIQHSAIALIVPAAPLVFASVVSWFCLHRADFQPETRRRCRRAFLYFDAAYSLFPQMLFSIVLILYANSVWLSEQIWQGDSYSVFNFVMGFPLGLAGFWPGYVLFVQIPRLLFDAHGYGEPEGIVSASARRPRPWTRFFCGAATMILLLGSLVALAFPVYEAPIPPPSGPFAVGRIGYDWADPARLEILSPVPNSFREIMVYVWYPAPAKPSTPIASYFPDADKVDQRNFAEIAKAGWGDPWRLIVSGNVRTHARDKAPVASTGNSFPLIIFSPGYRIEPFAYTHQIQELVSRGYIVAAILHTYDVGVTTFPDGRMVSFSEENYRRSHVGLEKFHKWEDERISVWAGDIRFTLDQITELNMGHTAPFAGRVDLGRVGAFGHAFGGAAAARACQLDQRFKGCLNQEGIPMNGPFLHYEEPILRSAGGYMPGQAFMFLRGGAEPLETWARERFQAMVDEELQNVSGSTYEVKTPVYDYSDFTDRPLLQAAGNPAATAKALRSLRTVELYTNAFFDKFLYGAHDTLLDRDPPRNSGIRIKHYTH